MKLDFNSTFFSPLSLCRICRSEKVEQVNEIMADAEISNSSEVSLETANALFVLVRQAFCVPLLPSSLHCSSEEEISGY